MRKRQKSNGKVLPTSHFITFFPLYTANLHHIMWFCSLREPRVAWKLVWKEQLLLQGAKYTWDMRKINFVFSIQVFSLPSLSPVRVPPKSRNRLISARIGWRPLTRSERKLASKWCNPFGKIHLSIQRTLIHAPCCIYLYKLCCKSCLSAHSKSCGWIRKLRCAPSLALYIYAWCFVCICIFILSILLIHVNGRKDGPHYCRIHSGKLLGYSRALPPQ
jgi:hypothetical protein